MHQFQRLGRARSAVVAISIAAVTTTPLALMTAGGADAQPASSSAKHLYIVQVSGKPVATYGGGLASFNKTKPAPGKNVNTSSQAARAYNRYLQGKHLQVLDEARVADSAKVTDYSVAFNGFAARLTSTQAATMEHTDGVLRVWKNEILSADTVSTPKFLGLDGADGAWAKQFGGPAHAGEGVIVGVIDSGFTPENPSFAALPEPRADDADIAAQFHGTCQAGTTGPPVTCNNKVLGARYYNESGLAQSVEFLSPRDVNGHGSHTSSTAAGDNGVEASINGAPVGKISGMAPAARLSIYKALWHNPTTGGASGGTVDLVNAIDDAVSDGVDVINYSVSGSRTLVVDPVELAFLNAADAGVFVSASAGNEGDTVGTSSVAHNSPWEMTVAASTHDRGTTKTATLGNGASYTGVGVGPAVPSSPLIDSSTAGVPSAPDNTARLCYSDADNNHTNGTTPVLDPAKVTGKIVLCERGTNDRVDKSLAVKNAGGVGMILFNPTPNSLNADFHTVPSIHVDQVAGAAIKTYAATTNPTASISAVDPTPVRAPEMGGFSSFGPALAGGGDLLKPDITAPGVDVIAAVAPATGNNFNAESGTSMSAPHIAGIAALIRSKHPTWSPMWIKSALMTTATALDNRNQPIQRTGHDATPLDYGAGHVRPAPAFDPGLVYDSTATDWLRYGCGINQIQLVTPASFCQDVGSIDPSDLNYPSISVGDLAGAQTITRTVTNTSTNQASQYTPTVQAPPGFAVKLSTTKMTVPPLESRSFKVTLTRTNAPLNQWAFGSFTWSDKRGHAVRSPIAVRPVALAAPKEVSFSGASGSGTVTVTPGYSGTLATTVNGLVPATVTPTNLTGTTTSFNANAPATSNAVARVDTTVPAGTNVLREATYDADYPAGTDIDLFLYRNNAGTLSLVGNSAGGTSEESITLNAPAAGQYSLFVVLFAVPSGQTGMTVKPNTYVLGSTPAGNLTADPATQTVTSAQPATVTANWSGLNPATRYLGALQYSDGASTIGRTLVSVTSP